MVYTRKQNSTESEAAQKQSAKPLAQAFNDQRDSTSLQLKQQQFMQAAQAPAQLKAAEAIQLNRGARARALVNQGLQDMANDEAGAADAYDEDYDEDDGVQDAGAVEYEEDDDEAVAGEEDAEEDEAQAPGYPITVNGQQFNLAAGDISGGTLEPVPGRTNGDVQLRFNLGRHLIVLHVHPTAGSGGTPTGGGSSLNGHVGAVPGNVPQNIVDLIAAHPNYATVVASCAPRSAASASDNWRRN